LGQDPTATGSGARERGQPLRARAGIAALGLLAFLLTACGHPGVASSPQSAPRSALAVTPARGEMVAALAAEPVADRPAPLGALFRALERLEQHDGAPVRILQLGDSHTAGDYFTGELRALFQQRFGNAGRGTMAAGLPYKGVRQLEVHIAQTGRWTYHNSFAHPEEGPYGISAFSAESRSAGAALTLEAVDPEGFDRVEVELLRQPKGGVLDIEVDEKRLRRVATDGAQHLLRIALTVPAGSHSLRLRAADRRPLRILSWTIERRARGAIVDALGVSGATIGLVSKWSPEIVADELRHLNPALVILAYGTNEGFLDDFDEGKYRQTAAETLGFLRRAAPAASILVVGPPDGQHLVPASCYSRRGVGAEASCLRDAGAARGSGCAWVTPAPLATVREIERQEAARVGAAFWDWAAIMGGECAMHQWGLVDPPLGRADHIHMTAAGYATSADALFREIMAAYDSYRASEPRRPPPKRTRP
jgi:lysophospholipase L1-like esterase